MKYKYKDFECFDLKECLGFLKEYARKEQVEVVDLILDIEEELKNPNENPNECDRLIKEIVDRLNNGLMTCPMCKENKMYCKTYKGTYIYICEPCPFVGFEYIDKKDVKNMIEWLEKEINK